MSSIHNYSYKPCPIFKTSHDEFENTSDVKELLFGVELEIDKGEDAGQCSDDLVEVSDDIYCKHDGSLDCEGIEIVTHPCTLDYHLNCLDWPGIIKVAKDYGYKSHEARTCGLHVHVGRFQMGMFEKDRDETAGKIVLLVSRHWPEMVTFSRRRESQLNDWAARNFDDDGYGLVKESVISNALETVNRGRYQAVNLCNSSTVEFRLFNGTLALDTLKATLQLVSNIVKYAMTHDVDEVLASQWQDIIDIDHYDELTFYLNEKGLSLVPPKPAITFKYETMAEYEKAMELERREADRRRAIELKKQAIRENIRMYHRILNLRGVRVGDRVRIVNNEGYDVSALRRAIGREAVITHICRSANAHFDFEVRFDEPGFERFTHASTFNTGTGCNYYNLHRENVEIIRETAAEPVLAPAM